MARLCIADPPYLGRGAMLYGENAVSLPNCARLGAGHVTSRRTVGDGHPDAAMWDDPETHRQMVERLLTDYDGWAIALNPENLHDYLRWVPRDTRICSWVKPDAFPAGRIVRSWEPLLLHVPDARRGRGDAQRRDSLVASKARSGVRQSFIGSKPPVWTRWVLDMLGHDAETDTVDDLFHGSGAVAAEVAQGVLL